MYVPLQVKHSPNGSYVETGVPIRVDRAMPFGLRFDIEVLGYPHVVTELVSADGPIENKYSRVPAMATFYDRKRRGHLDEYTLEEAIELAKILVEATIATAPHSAGVGGPIDILTVTTSGVNWIAHKNVQRAELRSRHRIVASRIGRTADLDSSEYVRCTFGDGVILRYRGEADADVIDPTFEGKCTLVLEKGAAQRRPETVKKLRTILGPQCTIREEP